MKTMWVHFQDMADAARNAMEIAQSASLTDSIRKAALERYLEIMDEAAKRIPRDIQPQWREIPWKTIIDLRNVISHEYEVFSLKQLITTTVQHVPPVLAAIDTILAAQKD